MSEEQKLNPTNFNMDEKTDSISVSKTSTGKYSWDVKIYSKDLLNQDNEKAVIEKIVEINRILAEKFY